MAEYLRQQIVDSVVADLETILIDNGYKTNAGRQVHRKLKALGLVDANQMPYLSVCDGSETLEDETNREVLCKFTIMIYGYVHDVNDPHKILNYTIGDIKKVLWSDPERDDLAYATQVTSITTDEGVLSMQDKSMFNLECRIEYSHDRENP